MADSTDQVIVKDKSTMKSIITLALVMGAIIVGVMFLKKVVR